VELYYSFSALIVLASIFAYLNYRFLKLPSTIGIMVIAIVVSFSNVWRNGTSKNFGHLHNLMNSIDFTEVLMGAMLNFLLFAGGIISNDLKEQFRPVVIFSTVGVVISLS
jgi:CPA1 family monovalent cation:H+ antiporter